MERTDFAVKGIKEFMGMDCPGYNATLYYQGKKIADVVDDGSGGETDIQWYKGWKDPLVQEIEAWAKTLPPRVYSGNPPLIVPSSATTFIEDLVIAALEAKELKRKCRTKVIYAKGDDYYALSNAKPPVTPEMREAIKRHGGTEVINDRFQA